MSTKAESKAYQRFRLPAILVEGIPLTLMVMGLMLGINKLKVISFMTTAFLYMSVSFYLFKAEKYKVLDVIAAIFAGLMIAIILIGYLFQLMDWPNGVEMLTISKLSLNFGLLFSGLLVLAKNLKVQRRPFEFTMSLKLFSRFLILLIYFYASGMHQSIPIPI
ncbi:MAG: hypothetical protein AB8H47_20330 [Bacteroidia bacterium]